MDNVVKLFDEIINEKLLVRKLSISFSNLLNENIAKKEVIYKQFDLFSNTLEIDKNEILEKVNEEKENKLQNTIISIQNKYGRNSLVKAMNLESGATTMQRNKQVGGHQG